MKKVIKLLSVILVLSSLFVAAAFAADEAEFAVTPSAEEVKVGEEFTVDVELVTNPGIEGIEFEVAYDANHFELVDSSIAISGTSDFDGEFFYWFNMNGSDYTGSVLELTFKVLDYKAYEDSTITVQKLLAGTIDDQVDMDDVVVTITVTHKHVLSGDTYENENGQHWKACTVEGCDYTTEKTDCSGGTPTCMELAVCTVCDYSYGEYADCDYKDYDPTEVDYAALMDAANCENAAVYYKVCPTCGTSTYALYENEAKAEYIFTYGDPLPHTFTCENPDEKYLKSAADCDSAAEYYYSCETCDLSSKGTDYEGTFTDGSALGHDYTKQDTAEKYLVSRATCQEAAKYYYSCQNCGESSEGTDDENTFTYGDPDPLAHDWSSEWTQGDDTHYHKCLNEGCTEKGKETECSVGENGTNATCQTPAVCGDCGQSFGTVDAVNGHKADTVWTADDENDQHYHKCLNEGCTEKLDVTACSVGENGTKATCEDPAVCGTCGQSFGNVDPDGHKWKQGVSDGEGNHSAKCELCKKTEDSVPCAGTGANAPTCTEKGKCDVCDYVIPELGHDYDTTKWVETEDGKGHYHACSRCDDTTKDYAAHTGGTATCQALAKCETCNFEYGELAACDFTKKDTAAEGALAQAATCVAPAEYYYSCSVCGKVNNAEGAETFVYGDPDTVNGHKADTAWTADDENDQHYHKCLNEGCTEKLDVTACSGGTATCTEKAECSACGQEYGEIDPNNHDLKANPGTPATCIKDGVKAHWTCSRCDVLYAFTENGNSGVGEQITEENKDELYVALRDPSAHKWVWGKNETGHWEYCDYCYELCEDGVGPGDDNHPNTTPAPHVFGDWVTANGYKTKTCECGYYISEKVETTGTGTGSNVPATGDDTPIALWALVFLCSGAAAVALGLKKKEN